MRKSILDLVPVLMCTLLGSAGCMGPSSMIPGAADSSPAMGQPAAMKPAPSGPSSLMIHMVDGPISSIKEVNVDIQKVAILDAQGALLEIGAPNKVIDLLKLQGGLKETLAAVKLPAGAYPEMRLVLGDNSSLRLADDSVVSMKVPSGQQSGLKISINLNLEEDQQKELFVDFDVAESIHVVSAGRNSKYLLRPVLHAVEKQASGAIQGRLTASESGLPIAGAAVYAETRDGQGQPQIVRRVQSGMDGRYTLDLLPLGASYVVVSQPAQAGVVYEARVSSALSLSAQMTSANFDASFSPASQVGGLQIQVTPQASDTQSDSCMVLQGDAGQQVIVKSDVPVQESSEQVVFGNLPAGSYQAQCLRRSPDANGAMTTTLSQTAAATVSAEMTSAIQIGF